MTLDDADALFRGWMRDNLLTAAEHFQVTISGEPVFGWLDRSISVSVTKDGAEYWLRVVSEDPQWVHLDFWTGNQDATILTTLPKPTVLDTIEWDEHRRQRAELMTRLPGRPCSATLRVEHWETAHGDLHWANLLCPGLGILDTPAGRIAQLYVIARLLHRARRGEHLDLVEPLTRYAQALLS